ncbi:MAG: sulfoxide reductase heme-binding subunit YedZ, partial [Candidatus Competibacteraceae bacterium]|nr:sulfoxide reductase heme-binding subunit YedZ [Candidatus Competibacteraceae bacterium]
GFTAFILLIPLAITSTKRMMQRLKRNWQRVHRLVYPAAGLAAVHFLWLVKADLLEPMIYLSVLLVLLGYRVWRYWQKRTKIEHAVAIVLSSER